MGRRSWGKPDFRDLTVEELSNLLYLSYTDSREHQRDYLVSLVGFVTYPDLDYMLSVGRDHDEARLEDCMASTNLEDNPPTTDAIDLNSSARADS